MEREVVNRADAMAVARACAERLRSSFGARRVIIFGSLTAGGTWHGRSDIDLAVEGLAPELFWRAWADLDDLLPSGLEVDLVSLEEAGPELRARILGEVAMPDDPLERLQGLIADEFVALERIQQRVAEALAGLHEEPGQFEQMALAGYLHGFYTGVENIFERIAVELDRSLPRGEYWHMDLLVQMAEAQEGRRGPVIDEPLRVRLREYARFRHFFRHAYDYELEWVKLRPLVEDMAGTLADLKTQVEAFLRKYREQAS